MGGGHPNPVSFLWEGQHQGVHSPYILLHMVKEYFKHLYVCTNDQATNNLIIQIFIYDDSMKVLAVLIFFNMIQK